MRTEISWKRRLLRKKLKYMLLSVCAVGVVFVVHQLYYSKELDQAIIGKLITGSAKDFRHLASESKKSKWDKHSKLIRDQTGRTVSLRGTRDRDISRYLPDARGKFVCFKSRREIDFMKVNDDFCDCPLDGSDEPGTNACNNGVFNCDVPSPKFTGTIPSYKVNDGYCDCCDGSDEWAEVALGYSLDSTGISYHKVKCSNKC